ncbi:hypothetical protein BH721_01150 [Clostridium baratii]|uniref:hypothetical protein n=1 Tax=Clostridium baratii TaxID=1561 RepID=UPI0009A373EC|nr:hypothetical protein [Clostridium baratii]OPF51583.1 hypothetical protein A1M12_03325 [Clostridium baratii]OPF55346.1 hypothetical protein BH721_01150 [Clostridium baratii]OPF57629.1 hypothetical protein BH724_08405 [Clostridium baratii]OPF60273.1 hypothetical protein BH725_06775 [Clostridium baratii]
MNKNFIPNEFIKIKNEQNKNSVKRGILLLFVVNIILLPMNLSSFKQPNNIIDKNNDMLNYTEDNDRNLNNELLKQINLIDKYSKRANINKNTGEILLEDYNNIENINKIFKVQEISRDDEDYVIKIGG